MAKVDERLAVAETRLEDVNATVQGMEDRIIKRLDSIELSMKESYAKKWVEKLIFALTVTTIGVVIQIIIMPK